MKSDDFRCKNCGGMMRFDPKSGNLKCENCETEEKLPKVFTHKRHDIDDYEERIKSKISEEKTIVQIFYFLSCLHNHLYHVFYV